MNRRDALKQTVALACAGLAMPVPGAWACKIEKQSDDDGATTGKSGETSVITVSVRHTHRRCTVPIEKTEFAPVGLKILGATPWKQTGSGSYERKLKVVFLQKGKATLRVLRRCSRGGCSQELEFAVTE